MADTDEDTMPKAEQYTTQPPIPQSLPERAAAVPEPAVNPTPQSLPEGATAVREPASLLEQDKALFDETTPRGQEIKSDESQQGFLENVAAGFEQTALADLMVMAEEEYAPLVEEKGGDFNNALDRLKGYGSIMLGERAGGVEDYSDKYDALVKDIPAQFFDEIIGHPNAEAAARARARVITQLDAIDLNSRQTGLSPQLAMLAGGLFDVDAPLMLVTGGGYKAAQITGTALRVSQKAGLSAKAALRVSSGAVGMNAGLQAGALVGFAQANVRETADWTLVAESALQGMVLGGAMNSVLKGDVALSVRAAQAELHTRIRNADPSIHEDLVVDAANAQPLRPKPFVEERPEVDSSVGARQVQPGPGVPQTPIDTTSDAIKDIGAMADNWRHDSDWQDYKDAEVDMWWAKVAQHPAFNIATANSTEMFKSKSSVMNWMLGNVFESPSGLGRGAYTAATGMEGYHRQIAQAFVAPVEAAAKDWGRRKGKLHMGQVPDQNTIRAFNREVMLEMNDRLMGRNYRSGPVDPAIAKAADAYGDAGRKALEIGQGRAGEHSIDGFENLPVKEGYSPYVWRGQVVQRLMDSGIATKADIATALEAGYRAAGMHMQKDASVVAKAVMARMEAGAKDIDTNLVSLLSGDGRLWLDEALELNGVSKVDRKALMDRLTGKVKDAKMEGYAKHRNNIDLGIKIKTSDGSDVRLVDLMDDDLHGTWQKYARKVSGSAALARVGVTNKAQRSQIIKAAQAQQRALGEKVTDAAQLEAMFSHFDGGPVHGFHNWLGSNESIAPGVALVKRMTNLSLLGKLGFAQVAETAAGIAAAGFENWWLRGPASAFNAQLKTDRNGLLSDTAFLIGDLGQDQRMFSEHLDLDDINASDRGTIMAAAQGLSQKATALQATVSGFNAVRGIQHKVVTAAITDKIFRTIKKHAEDGDYPPEFLARMRTDLGIFPEELRALEGLVANGTIEFKTRGSKTYVNRINAAKWSPDIALKFGSSLTRNLNQVVQKSLAGEQDTWLHTNVGTILSHLKTFPLQSMQKQFIRNVRHTDAQSLNTIWMGMATAGLAIAVRDAIDGKERSTGDLAKTAFGYANLTGWVPMAWDPAMTLLGLEDYRVNQYGPHSDYTPATVTWANRAMRLPGATIDTLTGQADYYDSQAMKALPFANLAGLARIHN